MAETTTKDNATADVIAELQRQLADLQTKMSQQGGVPLDSHLTPLSKPIDPKGMHKGFVAQLKDLHFRQGMEKDGTKVRLAVKVGNINSHQTAVLKNGTWVLDSKSATMTELSGEATEKDTHRK